MGRSRRHDGEGPPTDVPRSSGGNPLVVAQDALDWEQVAHKPGTALRARRAPGITLKVRPVPPGVCREIFRPDCGAFPLDLAGETPDRRREGTRVPLETPLGNRADVARKVGPHGPAEVTRLLDEISEPTRDRTPAAGTQPTGL